MHFQQKVILLTAVFVAPWFFSGAESFEDPPVLSADGILEEDLMQSPVHSVGKSVNIVRYGYQFELTTEAGIQDVWSKAVLIKRIQEANAIAQLKEIGQTEAFIQSITTAAKNPIMNAYSVVSRPVETVKGLPSGASRYFKGKLYWIKKSKAEVSTKTKEYAGKIKDIGTNPSDSMADVSEMTEEAKTAAYDATKEHLGYNKAKRTWAKRLNVHPYSDNPELHEALERIAWATSLGSFAADYTIPSYDVLNYADDIKNTVWETAPIELEQQNDARLKEAGIDEEVILAFHDHDQYNISAKTAIAMVVEQLNDVEGISSLVETILGAEDHSESVMMLKIAAVLQKYHSEVNPLLGLEVRRGMITANDTQGNMILPVAVDYLYWTSTAHEVASDKEFDHPKKQVWLTGQISRHAMDRLNNLDWEIKENCLDL